MDNAREVLMTGKVAIALTAAFGGISPNLLMVAICLTGTERRDPGINAGYIVGLLLFAVLGGAVALIWGERDPKRAFYLGLGLPSMLQIAMSGVGSGNLNANNTAAEPERGAFYFLSTPAYAMPLNQVSELTAQDRTAQEPARVTFEAASTAGERFDLRYQKSRSLTVLLDDVPEGTELLLSSPDGKVTSQIQLAPNDENGRVDLKLPDFASKFSLRAGNLLSETYDLNGDQGSSTRYKVDIDSKFWGGFLRALGVASAKPYQFEVELAPE